MTVPLSGERPRSKSLVRLDLHNAYARLGVSPLASTEEIKRVADEKRRELMRRRRSRGQQHFGAEEAEMAEVQQIEGLIGTPKARAAYDRAFPQNELLTVQPSPHDRWLDPRFRDGLITAWLVEELGRDAPLPSPESLALWVPCGLAREVSEFLRGFVKAGDAPAPVSAPPEGEGPLPGPADLDRLLTDEPSPPSSEEPARA
jgi:hypothetical protein